MQGGVRAVCRSSALLAAMAFGVTWQMTSKFDDDLARSVIAIYFASWVAVGSGISGFLLRQTEETLRPGELNHSGSGL